MDMPHIEFNEPEKFESELVFEVPVINLKTGLFGDVEQKKVERALSDYFRNIRMKTNTLSSDKQKVKIVYSFEQTHAGKPVHSMPTDLYHLLRNEFGAIEAVQYSYYRFGEVRNA